MAPQKMFLVEKIMKKRVQQGKTEYYIKWQGYPMSASTWEPAENCNCPDAVDAFERSSKPKGRKRRSNANGSMLPRPKQSRAPGKTRAVKTHSKPEGDQNDESSESDASSRAVKTPAKPEGDQNEESSQSEASSPAVEPPAQPQSDQNEESGQAEELPPRKGIRRVAGNSSSGAIKKIRFSIDVASNDEPCSSTQARSLVNNGSQSRTNVFTPASKIADLKFKVSSVKKMLKPHGDEVVVFDAKGKQHIVKCKAVAKQNLDLMLNYLMALDRD